MATQRGSPVTGSSVSGALVLNKTLTAGSSLLLSIEEVDSTGSSTMLPTVTGGGTWTQFLSTAGAAFHQRLSIWRLDLVTAGSTNVTITPNVNGNALGACLTEWTPLGAAGTAAKIDTAFQTSTSVGPSGAASTGDLVLAAMCVTTAPAGTSSPASTGYTAQSNINDAASTLKADTKIASAGTQSADWGTLVTGTRVSAVVVYFPDAPLAPIINTQPLNARVPAGAAASYSVSATTSGGALTYQWQSNQSGSVVNISGATNATLTTATLAAGTSYAVRCNVTDSNGTTSSEWAQAWTPARKPAAWAGLYSSAGNRAVLQRSLLWPSSKASGKVAENAMFGGIAGTLLKFWTGSTWTTKPVKFWSGSAWVTKTLKRWNGAWQ